MSDDPPRRTLSQVWAEIRGEAKRRVAEAKNAPTRQSPRSEDGREQ